MRKTGKHSRSKTHNSNSQPVSGAPAPPAPVEDSSTSFYWPTGRHYLYMKRKKAEYEVYMYDPDEQLHTDRPSGKAGHEAAPAYDPYRQTHGDEADIVPFHANVPAPQEGHIPPFVVGQPAPVPAYLQTGGQAPDQPQQSSSPTPVAPTAHPLRLEPAAGNNEPEIVQPPAPDPLSAHEHTDANAGGHSHNGIGNHQSFSTGPMTEPAMPNNTSPFAMTDPSLSSSSSLSSGSLTSPMFEPYEAQPIVWNDVSLASVEDFTTVLFAIRSSAGKHNQGDGAEAGQNYDDSQVTGRTTTGQSTQSVATDDTGNAISARPDEPSQAVQEEKKEDGYRHQQDEHGAPSPDIQPPAVEQIVVDEYALFISDLAAHLRAEKQQEQAPGQEPAEQSPLQPRLATTAPKAEAGPSDITAIGSTPTGGQELLAEVEDVTPFSPEETAPAVMDAYAGPQGDHMLAPQAQLQADVPATEPGHAQPGEDDGAYAGQAQGQAQEVPDQQVEMEESETGGRFRGEELQFEDFMFDKGAPLSAEPPPSAMAIQAFQWEGVEAGTNQSMPDATEGAVAEQVLQVPQVSHDLTEPQPITPLLSIPSPEPPIPIPIPIPMTISPDSDEADQLPFWLRDTTELTAIPELQIIEEAEEAEWTRGVAETPVEVLLPTPVGPETDEQQEPEPSALSADTVPDDYLDLPPIEPFDFSILQLAEGVAQPTEDTLGFRTGELLGSMVPVQETETEPASSGAGLNVLDRLLEAGPPPLLEAVPAGADGDMSVDITAAGGTPYTGEYNEYDQYGAQTGQLDPDTGIEAGTADQPTTFIHSTSSAGAGTDRPFNWTSMMTGSLMGDANIQAPEEAGELSALAGNESDSHPTTLMSNAEEVTVSDLGVDPFDFNKLDLEEEEPPTEFLPASATQPVLVPGTEKLHTSFGMGANGGTTSATQSSLAGGEAQAEEASGSSIITGALPSLEEEDEEELWRELGSDTSLFITSHLTQAPDEAEPRGSPATSWLGEAAEDAAVQQNAAGEEGTQTQEAEGVKARVTADVWTTRRMLTLQDIQTFDIEETTETGAGESSDLGAQAEPEYAQPPLPENRGKLEATVEPETQTPQPEPVVEAPPKPRHKATRPLATEPSRPRVEPDDAMISSGSSALVSGPLPVLGGFEELLELVTYNPQDMGAHMALAAAYTQAGHLDAALRVYRRMLKKRNNVPTYMLQIIAEELADFEGEFGDQPRFHQVRGDLYMKQGRFREAIDEYNKIR